MKAALSGILILTAQLLWSQDNEAAMRVYGGPLMDEARAIVETADGGYTLLGTTASVAGDATDFYLLHINEDLSFAWSRPLGGIESDQGRCMVQYDNGDLLLGGFSNATPGGDYDALVFRTDADGEVIWEKNYGSTDWDFCEDIALMSDGSFVLVGNTYAGAGGKNTWIMRADENGNILWEVVLESPYEDWAEDVLLTSSGTLLVARNVQESEESASLRPHILEMDLSGTILVEEAYGSSRSVLLEIEEDDNSYAGIGWYQNDGAEDRGQMVLGINADLMEEWVRLEVAPGDLALRALATTPYGWVTVGPGNGLGAGGYAAYIQSRTTDGWYLYGYELGGVQNEDAHDVLVDSQDRLVLCGSSASYSTFEDMDAFVIRVDTVMLVPSLIETVESYTDVSLNVAESGLPDAVQVQISREAIIFDSPLGTEFTLEVFTASGSMVRQASGSGDLLLSLEGLPAGIYVLRGRSAAYQFTKKILR